MRVLSFRRTFRRLFSFASMGISRVAGRGIRRRNQAFKQRRDSFNCWRLDNEMLEPKKMLAADIGGKTPDLIQIDDSGWSDTDNYTNVNTPTFELNTGGLNFGSTPAASGPERVDLLINGNVVATKTGLSGTEPNIRLTVPTALADGTYTVTFRTVDSQTTPATSTSQQLTFTIDTTIDPLSSRLVAGGNINSGVFTPGDEIVITLTFSEEVQHGAGNTENPGDTDTFINLNVGTPLSATDAVQAEVTGVQNSGGNLVTEEEYRFSVTANPGTSTDADGVYIDSAIGIFYDRAGNSVNNPSLNSFRGFKTGTLTFTNPVTTATFVGVLDNSQISYPVSGITLLLDAPVPGPPVTPVGVAVGIADLCAHTSTTPALPV